MSPFLLENLPLPDTISPMYEATGNMHIHTPYSDGEKFHEAIAQDAIKAGLDFLIITDHNIWVDGLEAYYENDEGRVLLLVGEEVHNMRRNPQASHFLAYGADAELVSYAKNPQELIDKTNELGGFGFLAHPFERGNYLVDLPDIGWHDWPVEHFAGLEIWNYMTSCNNALMDFLANKWIPNKLIGKIWALDMAFKPDKYVMGPLQETLDLWDEMLASGKRVAAIGGADAHGTPMSLGPIHRTIYPYEYLFRQVNTHILTKEPLSGDFAHDKQQVLNGMKYGNAWVGYDGIEGTHGFKFTATGMDKGTMGQRVRLNAGITFQVSLPMKGRIRMIHNGKVVAEEADHTNMTYIGYEEGAYRVECMRMYKGKERGWIYSNPIYIV